MKQPIIDLVDLQIILFIGSESAKALAIEFNASTGYILLPNYRLN